MSRDRHEERVDRAIKRIRKVNAARRRDAAQGPPGDPPTYICEMCGLEECAEDCPSDGEPIS